jgi:hypothetical protein
MAQDHAHDWMEMNNAVLAFDFDRAIELSKKIGLDEHRIIRQGGGLNWVVAVIAIAAVVLLASDRSHEPSGSSGGGSGEGSGSGRGELGTGGGGGSGTPTQVPNPIAGQR